MRFIIIVVICVAFAKNSFGQGACTQLGQTPPTAFPVCGSLTFQQLNVPICTTSDLFVPGCTGTDNALYQNKNPFWYKFTCYQSGTLGFLITPNDLGDDYDWQLYDVTGLDPDAVFTNHNIIVTGNWSGSYGTTGASSTGVNYIQCASDPATQNTPRFAAMPNIIAGHNYLLLISHYTDSQSGYSLSFGGGTGVITDPLDPHLVKAEAPCDGTEIRIYTNKKMRCNTLAPDGSDFIVTNSSNVDSIPIAASSFQCSSGFDADTMSIFLSGGLAPGTYTVKIKNGTDFNTLLDVCGKIIPPGESVQFTVYPLLPTPLDSITKPKCAPQTLEIVFKKKILCNSIDPNGGEFNITGPYPVSVTGATYTCVNGETTKILLSLSQPLTVDGTFVLHLQNGPDGNTIIDECGVETPLPAQVSFHVADTVNAAFTYSTAYTCEKDIVSYMYASANHVNFWHWTFGGPITDNFTQNPSITYFNFEPKPTTLIVSNGVCIDTASILIIFDNYIKADFDVSALVCPGSKAVFTNKTLGTIIDWKWTIGNGNILSVKDPAPQTYVPFIQTDYTALPQLIAENNFGCYDTTMMPVKVVYSCFITVPTAFTPNGDGLNDYLYPLKAYKSTNLTFSIYNRFGQRVFYSTSWLNKWDGTYRGLKQDPGTFVWMLDYINTESGKHVFEKGTSILIR